MLSLLFPTKDPAIAAHALDCGADRIFVDLEILGKVERQGHLDTRISRHSLQDAIRIRRALPEAPLLVRINPVNPGTTEELEAVLDAGADVVMLPMFTTRKEVARVVAQMRGRAVLSILVETAAAAVMLPHILAEDGIGEVYIGLNDLHLGLGLDFLFEPVANGLLDRLADTIRARGLPFGFGGIGRMGSGPFPADRVLSEHVRLGSSFCILARSFTGQAETLEALLAGPDLRMELGALRAEEARLRRCTPADLEAMHRENVRIVDQVAQASRTNLAQAPQPPNPAWRRRP